MLPQSAHIRTSSNTPTTPIMSTEVGIFDATLHLSPCVLMLMPCQRTSTAHRNAHHPYAMTSVPCEHGGPSHLHIVRDSNVALARCRKVPANAPDPKVQCCQKSFVMHAHVLNIEIRGRGGCTLVRAYLMSRMTMPHANYLPAGAQAETRRVSCVVYAAGVYVQSPRSRCATFFIV